MTVNTPSGQAYGQYVCEYCTILLAAVTECLVLKQRISILGTSVSSHALIH